MENIKKNLPNSELHLNRFNNYPINNNSNRININNYNSYKTQSTSNKPQNFKSTFTINNYATRNKADYYSNYSSNSINSMDKVSTNSIDEQSSASNRSINSIINKIQFSKKEISYSKINQNDNSNYRYGSTNASINNTYTNNQKYLNSSVTKSIANNSDNKQNSSKVKDRIEKARAYEEIILPSGEIYLEYLNITKPIKIKGQTNTCLHINEGPIVIDIKTFNSNNIKSNNNIVKFSQIQIIYNDNKICKDQKITTLFKIHPNSFLELEDCDIVLQNKRNGHSSLNQDKKSVAFLLFSNKKEGSSINLNPSSLTLTNSRLSNFYQSIRAGQNCIVNINKSAFMRNYGKAIVMINPIFLKVSETLFENNEENIHIKYMDECLYEEKRKLFFNKSEFDKSLGNDICVEGEKNDKLDLSIVITKNNFHNCCTDAVLIYDLIYNYFEITDNIFKENKGNGLNIQKSFFDSIFKDKFNKINSSNLYLPIKIKDNKFIENKGFGLFINDCIIEVIGNKFSLNRQSGMILCNIIIDDPKMGLEGINLKSIRGDISSILKSIKKPTTILKNSFYENGESGLQIYGYPYQINIQETVFTSNCKNGILANLDCLYAGNNNNFLAKLNEYQSITQIQKIYDLVNIKLNKCIIEKNLKSGLLLNSCLIYCEETFITNNINYAISIKKREYQNCFKEGKKNCIKGSIGGDWGEINLDKEAHCGFSCMPKVENNFKKKEEIIKMVPNYLNQSDDTRSIDEGFQRKKGQSFNDFNLNHSDRVYMKRNSTKNINRMNKDKEDEGGCYIY